SDARSVRTGAAKDILSGDALASPSHLYSDDQPLVRQIFFSPRDCGTPLISPSGNRTRPVLYPSLSRRNWPANHPHSCLLPPAVRPQEVEEPRTVGKNLAIRAARTQQDA